MKKLLLFVSVFIFVMTLASCGDNDSPNRTNDTQVPRCEVNEVYMDGECKIPSPEQIDFALSNSLNFELTGNDLEYHYFIIQFNQVDSFGGTYKLEYWRVDEETSYFEEGLYLSTLSGYVLERDDHPNGLSPLWTLQSNGAGLYLSSVTHVESTDEGSQTIYDVFPTMNFDLVID